MDSSPNTKDYSDFDCVCRTKCFGERMYIILIVCYNTTNILTRNVIPQVTIYYRCLGPALLLFYISSDLKSDISVAMRLLNWPLIHCSLINIGAGNGLPLNQYHTITSTNVDILLIGISVKKKGCKIWIQSHAKNIWKHRLQIGRHFLQASMC